MKCWAPNCSPVLQHVIDLALQNTQRDLSIGNCYKQRPPPPKKKRGYLTPVVCESNNKGKDLTLGVTASHSVSFSPLVWKNPGMLKETKDIKKGNQRCVAYWIEDYWTKVIDLMEVFFFKMIMAIIVITVMMNTTTMATITKIMSI